MKLRMNLVLLALAAVLLFFLPDLLKLFFDKASVSYLSLLINATSLAILALSWDILARTGQLSLAHAAFFGAGAYSTAILVKQTDVSLWLGLPLAALSAVLLALLLGSVTLQLRGIYFAIATLSFAEVLKAVIQKLPSSLAGGAAGINVEPLFRPQFIAGEMERWEIAFLRNESYFLLYAGLLLATIVLSLLIESSSLSYAFSAIRTNEEVAAVMGVKAARFKLLAFVLSSMPVGILGAIQAHRIGSVSPDETFNVGTTVLALVTPIFGGLYTSLGPILGALGLASIEEFLRRTFSEGYLIGYGIVLVLSILFMPKGIMGLLRSLRKAQRESL
ncbi:MAG: branched-chain amino acid ABC transporter permease [Trueperaceae bacterium]|nr:branched-chain amino acid ABC transporter permease [Trueperaceae bacterium]